MDLVELVRGERFRVMAIRTRSGEPGPIERYMLDQDHGHRAKLFAAVERFAGSGPSHNPEHCRRLKGVAAALVELKVKPSRLMGFYCPVTRGVLVLAHGFHKRSRETPAVEIKRALDLREEYLRWLQPAS